MKNFENFLEQIDSVMDDDFLNKIESKSNSINDPVESAIAASTAITLHLLQKYHEWLTSDFD